MEKRFVRVDRYKDGYRVEGTDKFKDYFPVTTAGILAHDLYEHCLNEDGTHWQEIRAFGARLLYKDKDRAFAPQEICDYLKDGALREEIPAHSSKIDLPLDCIEHYSEMFGDFKDMALAIISAGYAYARHFNYPRQAHDKILNLDIAELIDKYKNSALIFDLQTGNYEVINKLLTKSNSYATMYI